MRREERGSHTAPVAKSGPLHLLESVGEFRLIDRVADSQLLAQVLQSFDLGEQFLFPVLPSLFGGFKRITGSIGTARRRLQLLLLRFARLMRRLYAGIKKGKRMSSRPGSVTSCALDCLVSSERRVVVCSPLLELPVRGVHFFAVQDRSIALRLSLVLSLASSVADARGVLPGSSRVPNRQPSRCDSNQKENYFKQRRHANRRSVENSLIKETVVWFRSSALSVCHHNNYWSVF